jgi:hypothetical protein
MLVRASPTAPHARRRRDGDVDEQCPTHMKVPHEWRVRCDRTVPPRAAVHNSRYRVVSARVSRGPSVSTDCRWRSCRTTAVRSDLPAWQGFPRCRCGGSGSASESRGSCRAILSRMARTNACTAHSKPRRRGRRSRRWSASRSGSTSSVMSTRRAPARGARSEAAGDHLPAITASVSRDAPRDRIRRPSRGAEGRAQRNDALEERPHLRQQDPPW